jgi:hypothetical protein
MHEVGHTMGLTHSNENGKPYADFSGYMAAGYKSTDWPRKCFNGHKVRIELNSVLFVQQEEQRVFSLLPIYDETYPHPFLSCFRALELASWMVQKSPHDFEANSRRLKTYHTGLVC